VALGGSDGRSGEPRGMWSEGGIYSKLDRVSFNGSEWIAKYDEPGPLPGDGWMLATQAKRGKPGERGPVGPPGSPGPEITSLSIDGYAVLLGLANGKSLSLDMRPLFELYDRERTT
jgi:hypothetical protein